jgi:Uma2 family endonuclease
MTIAGSLHQVADGRAPEMTCAVTAAVSVPRDYLPTLRRGLHSMAMASSLTRWTTAMLRALPDDGFRHEVVDGEHIVTPAPSWTHQDAVAELYSRLRSYVREHRIGHVTIAPAEVEFDEHNMVEPDLFVVPLVSGRKPRTWAEVRTLLLAVEVVSPSTARADRLRKRLLYRRHGVPEYWIVDVDARVVERWRAAEGVGALLTETIVWQPDAGVAALTVDLGEYFRDVTGEA